MIHHYDHAGFPSGSIIVINVRSDLSGPVIAITGGREFSPTHSRTIKDVHEATHQNEVLVDPLGIHGHLTYIERITSYAQIAMTRSNETLNTTIFLPACYMSVERKLYFETKDGDRFYNDHYNDIRIIVREKDGYINATRIATDNGKQKNFSRFIDSARWNDIISTFRKQYLESEVLVDPMYILHSTIPDSHKDARGTYVHPKLIHFIAEWVSLDYAFKVSHIMDLLNEELHNRTITLEQKIAELEQEIENANTGKRVVLGEIIIRQRGPNTYHIYPKQRASRVQVKNAEKLRYYNSVQVFNLFKFYAKHGLIDGISVSDKGMIKGDIALIKSFIDMISKRSFRSNLSFNDIIRLAKTEAIRSRNITRNAIHGTINASTDDTKLVDHLSPQQQGFLFEIYCAEKYNLLPYKYDASEDLGYNKQDIGCDLMDFDKNTYAQCKYYLASNLREDQVSSYLSFVDAVAEDDAKFMLIVNEEIRLFKPILELLELYDIELIVEKRSDFMDWLNTFANETALWTSPTTINETVSDIGSDTSSSSESTSSTASSTPDYDKFMQTARAWIAEGRSAKLDNGLYKEPPQRVQYMGFDFGRCYHTYGKTGRYGESIKEELANMFFYPPDFKRTTDEERLSLLTEFWDSNHRLPQLTDIIELPSTNPLNRTVNGLSYRRLYELCVRSGSNIRAQVTELFKDVKVTTARSSSLTNSEVLSLFTRFKETHNRIPRCDDIFENINIYRLWLSIKNGERSDIRAEVLSLFE